MLGETKLDLGSYEVIIVVLGALGCFGPLTGKQTQKLEIELARLGNVVLLSSFLLLILLLLEAFADLRILQFHVAQTFFLKEVAVVVALVDVLQFVMLEGLPGGCGQVRVRVLRVAVRVWLRGVLAFGCGRLVRLRLLRVAVAVVLLKVSRQLAWMEQHRELVQTRLDRFLQPASSPFIVRHRDRLLSWRRQLSDEDHFPFTRGALLFVARGAGCHLALELPLFLDKFLLLELNLFGVERSFVRLVLRDGNVLGPHGVGHLLEDFLKVDDWRLFLLLVRAHSAQNQVRDHFCLLLHPKDFDLALHPGLDATLEFKAACRLESHPEGRFSGVGHLAVGDAADRRFEADLVDRDHM